MSERHNEYRRYLDPAVLAQIGALDLRARLLVEGFISGMHRSPAHGFSVEFAEHRKYCQGDDLRFLDWKVYGRTDKHYIKEYEQETNLRLMLAVDCSESMSFRSPGAPMSKREYAITIAAAMAYLALQQADAVAVATFDEVVRRTSRASNNPGKWKGVVHELSHAPVGPKTSFRAVFDSLAESLPHRHLVVILSDLFGPVGEITAGIQHLRHQRHEPLVLQVLDHAELTFPFTRPLELVGLESTGRQVAEPRVVREHYLKSIQGFMTEIRRACHEHRTDYEVLDTSAPVNIALAAYLSTRAARARRFAG
jgi:uncharacterized protein (DUF58 family)